jgi:hypothetical protein
MTKLLETAFSEAMKLPNSWTRNVGTTNLKTRKPNCLKLAKQARVEITVGKVSRLYYTRFSFLHLAAIVHHLAFRITSDNCR